MTTWKTQRPPKWLSKAAERAHGKQIKEQKQTLDTTERRADAISLQGDGTRNLCFIISPRSLASNEANAAAESPRSQPNETGSYKRVGGRRFKSAAFMKRASEVGEKGKKGTQSEEKVGDSIDHVIPHTCGSGSLMAGRCWIPIG